MTDGLGSAPKSIYTYAIPVAMKGRRLPSSDLYESENHPIRGSVSTSKLLAKAVKNERNDSPAPSETAAGKEGGRNLYQLSNEDL